MKVRCISNTFGALQYRLTVGRDYVVLGLSVGPERSACKFWIKDDPGNYFVPTPAELFEVVDPAVSNYWVVELDGTGLRISAREFLAPHFLDRLTNFDEPVVATFRHVAAIIEREGRGTQQ
jgi:hypothetical protein